MKTNNKNKKSNSKTQKSRDKNPRYVRDSVRDCDERGFNAHKDNDVSWYAQSPQLLKDAASLPFSHVLGHALDVPYLPDYIMPGIMSLTWVPSLGCGDAATDAPTVSARYIYSYVRHANSGSANYEAPDLYMYIMAWASAAAAIEAGKRAYGMMLNYTARNRYYVDTMVTAMGFNPASIRMNMPGFRQVINLAVSRLNSLKIPAGLPIVARWKWMCSHVWVDDPGDKAQTYIFVPAHYFKWDGYGSETGTQLTPVYHMTGAESPKTVESYSDMLNTLLEALISEEDCGIMSGDIIKAYGDNLEKLSLIDETFITLPEYSEEVLTQIHNWYVPVSRTGNHPHSITQSDGVIQETYDITVQSTDGPVAQYLSNYILDMYHDGVTPEQVMVATRLSCACFSDPDESNVCYARGTGSEIPSTMWIWNKPIGQDADLSPTYSTILSNHGLYGSNRVSMATEGGVRMAAAISAFNWHPRLILEVGTDEARTAVGILGDLENYTVVSRDTLRNMNKIAILSECATTTATKLG